MAKLTDIDYCQSISDLHYAGVKWKAIAIIKSISYDYLMTEKSNPKSKLFKILTKGTKAKGRDIANGIITNIAMNGSKDSDKLNAAKYMLDVSDDTEEVKSTKSDAQILIDIKTDLK